MTTKKKITKKKVATKNELMANLKVAKKRLEIANDRSEDKWSIGEIVGRSADLLVDLAGVVIEQSKEKK